MLLIDGDLPSSLYCKSSTPNYLDNLSFNDELIKIKQKNKIKMPDYHFVTEVPATENLPEYRFTVSLGSETSKHNPIGVNKGYLIRGSPLFTIKDCLGSLIFIDRTRAGLNKLHIGELQIQNPHIETCTAGGKEGLVS